ILSVLALGAVFWPMHILNLAAVNAQGRSDLFFRLAVIKKIFAVGLIVIVSTLGPLAIAWAALAASIFALAVNTYYSRRLLNYGLMAQLIDQRATMGLALLAAFSGWLVLHFSPPGAAAI